jgi:hypothetical protein
MNKEHKNKSKRALHKNDSFKFIFNISRVNFTQPLCEFSFILASQMNNNSLEINQISSKDIFLKL